MEIVIKQGLSIYFDTFLGFCLLFFLNINYFYTKYKKIYKRVSVIYIEVFIFNKKKEKTKNIFKQSLSNKIYFNKSLKL